MKRSIAALALTTSLVFATSAFAQTLDKVVKWAGGPERVRGVGPPPRR